MEKCIRDKENVALCVCKYHPCQSYIKTLKHIRNSINTMLEVDGKWFDEAILNELNYMKDLIAERLGDD